MADSIKITGMKQLQKNILKISTIYPQEANKQIYISLLKIIAESDKNVNVDTGRLRDSSKVTNLAEIQKTGKGKGGYNTTYALDLHEGNPNPNVNFNDIYEWVKRKGIATDETGAYPIARVITEKIKRDGTKAYKFLEKALLKVVPGLNSDIAKELKKLERKVKT
jgi:hypothetical protein